MLHRELLVAGRLLSGSSGETVRSPWDGRDVGVAAVAGPSEVEAALLSAQKAFLEWRHAPASLRRDVLRRTAAILRERAEELAGMLVDEIGKPVTLAKGEVSRAALTFDLAADELSRPIGEILPADIDPRGSNTVIRTERFPLGVVLCITPYNWPFNLAAHKIAAALAAGNAVVVKVPTLAPLCGLALGHVLAEAGCPAGVANVIHCDNDLAGAIVKDDRVAMVSFTGSLRVGRLIQESVPHKKVALELGGDAYALIGPDADLDEAAAKVAKSAYGYAGQVCISVQHIRCHSSVAADFKSKLIREAENCPTGDPAAVDTVCGPLISDVAADRVMEWIQEAEDQGATLLAGGHRVGNTVWPTLLGHVPATTRLARDEVFGPVATFGEFETWRQAFDDVNSSKFGLQTGVFTGDLNVAESAYRSLTVGGVVVNDAPSLRFDCMPYGGEKDSGDTREGIRYTIEHMTTLRSIIITYSKIV